MPTLLALALGLLVSATLPAAADAPATLTIEQAVQEALSRNPAAAAANADVASARAGAQAASALTNPDITFTPGISGPAGSDEEFLVSQPLEISGTRSARAAVARAEASEAEAAKTAELLDVALQTKLAFIDLLRARQKLELARQMLDLAEQSHKMTEKQFELGARPGVDRTRTAVEASGARVAVAQASEREAAASAALNTALGRVPGSAIPALEQPAAAGDDPDDPGLTDMALRLRPEIAAALSRQEQMKHTAGLARAEGRPDLASQARAESITRGGIKSSGIGIAISIPIFDHGSRRARVRQAESAAESEKQRALAAQNQVRAEVSQAAAGVKAAREVAREMESGVLEQSRKLLEAAQTGFSTGQSNILMLIEAQRSYRAVQSSHIDAMADSAAADAHLDRAIGRLPQLAKEEAR